MESSNNETERYCLYKLKFASVTQTKSTVITARDELKSKDEHETWVAAYRTHIFRQTAVAEEQNVIWKRGRMKNDQKMSQLPHKHASCFESTSQKDIFLFWQFLENQSIDRFQTLIESVKTAYMTISIPQNKDKTIIWIANCSYNFYKPFADYAVYIPLEVLLF